jgi:sigma-B regulation protein RsbU (phosphoserine phosphatase)
MKRSAAKQYALLGVLLLWALMAQGIFSGFAIYSSESNQQARLPFSLRDYSSVIGAVFGDYQKGGFRPGDEIIAIDGERVIGRATIANVNDRLTPGARLTVSIRRVEAGRAMTLNIPLVIQAEAPPAIVWTYVIGVLVALPAICLLVGFYIAFARPLDPLAWITMAMLASFGQLAVQGQIISWSIWPPWRELVIVYHCFLNNTWPLWMVLFAFYFPRPFPFLRGRRWIVSLAAVLPAGFAALDIYGTLMQGRHIADLRWLYLFDEAIDRPQTIIFIGYVWAFFVCLMVKRARIKDADAIRRLRVMITGCGISLTPLIPYALSRVGLLPMLPRWLGVLALLMLLLFPLTIAYVIVVQRAMDVRMVVRSGLQHAMATASVRFLRIVLVVAIGSLTYRLIQQSEHRAVGIAIFATGAGAVIVLSRLARRIGESLDRRFFREAYNAERILMELISSVAGIRDIKRLMETVANRIASSLHVERVAFLLEQGGLFQPAYALGYNGAAPKVQLSGQTSTVQTLRRVNGPSKVYFDDPQSWVHGTSEVEQAVLQRLETQVLLPVSLGTKILGIISLGSKRSELPYSKADLQLLSAVAAQTGLALENAHLTESIRKEVAQRERLNRELEIARDVQQRLFPQKLPHVNGLDFAGYCRPAQGVGGDYYDFIHLANGSLGIAVGDVSGKGIAAALMMASLQASLRGQTIKPCETLSEMIHHINGLVYEASAASRYATFFYAQYDPVTRKLKYVNAGHNPPMLRRKKGEGFEFLRLEEGGTVIGMFPASPYKEAEIELHAGDVLVAFTDGISEAMNHSEEEFDEERLIEAIRHCPDRSAANISSHILEKVDAFTAGADQHDDMTIVVVRLL